VLRNFIDGTMSVFKVMPDSKGSLKKILDNAKAPMSCVKIECELME